MKKENRKMAQERRARERAKKRRREKTIRILVPTLIIAGIAALVIATIVSSQKDNTSGESVSGSSVTGSSVNSGSETSASSAGTTLDTTEGVAVEDGDKVNIDYTGYLDGEEFEGGSTEGNGTDLEIGSNTYIDGFEEGIIGHKTGETFDLNLTFPEDYGQSDLAGKDVTFTVTINGIYK
ncbi:MAG: FKBP-type peptidyl-prolyl cis-trans isomerase [Bilifractor sp.]|jgi:FKBP-type peptidyl-prolyl cis-trans isomerase (trigger factor)